MRWWNNQKGHWESSAPQHCDFYKLKHNSVMLKKSVSEDESLSWPIPSVAASRMMDVQLIAWTNSKYKPLKCMKDSFSIRVILISCLHLRSHLDLIQSTCSCRKWRIMLFTSTSSKLSSKLHWGHGGHSVFGLLQHYILVPKKEFGQQSISAVGNKLCSRK